MLLYFYRVFIFLDQTRGPILDHECGPSWGPPQQGTTSWTALQEQRTVIRAVALHLDRRPAARPFTTRAPTRAPRLHASQPRLTSHPGNYSHKAKKSLTNSIAFSLSATKTEMRVSEERGFSFSEGGISWI